MKKLTRLHNGLIVVFCGILIVALQPFGFAFAAPPASPYAPGETIAPSCAPGDINCTVSMTTTNVSEGGNLYFTNGRVMNVLDTMPKEYFFATSSALYWQSISNFFSTTSANFWLTQKNTDSLNEGLVNKYYRSVLFAADLSGTTTDAVKEGAGNKYFTSQRVEDSLATLLQAGSGINLLHNATDHTFTILANNQATSTDTNWMYQSGLVRLATTTNQVVIGGTATTSNVKLTVYGGASFDTATSSSLTVTQTASTSNLVVSNSFSFGTITGIVRATAGAIAASFVNLASDVSGILGVGNGGTGWATIAAGALLYGNGSGALSTTSPGVAGQVLAYVNGMPVWVATTTFSGALTYSNGAVTINAGAIGNGLLANSAITVSAGTGLSGGGSVSLGATATLSLNTANANNWTALQTFAAASSTLLSITRGAYFGGTATSSFDVNGVLSLAGVGTSLLLALDSSGRVVGSSTPAVASINATSTLATTTLAGGLLVGSNKLVVDRITGNVGIGTSSPGSTLSVAGRVLASSFNGTCIGSGITGFSVAVGVTACNQDVAEVYDAAEATEPGDIIAIPPSNDQQFESNALVRVAKARGTPGERLLGVVSLNPGLVFNNGATTLAGANTSLTTSSSTVIALSGRVLVKISLENGPVIAGDELTQSTTTPGVAVRALAPGMIIGTALQSVGAVSSAATTTPQILMFVNLHWSLGNRDVENSQSGSFGASISNILGELGIAISNGVASIGEIISQKITTHELCIEEVCLNKSELKTLLEANSASAAPGSSGVAPTTASSSAPQPLDENIISTTTVSVE